MRARALPPGVWEKLWRHTGYTKVASVRSWLELYNWTCPEGRSAYLPLWTTGFSVLLTALFMYMAGAFPAFSVTETTPGSKQRTAALEALSPGPWGMYSWVSFWNYMLGPDEATSFDFDFLLLWGAKYNVSLAAGQWWRWFTSLLLHQHINHLLTNLIMFIEFAYSLEVNYGTPRLVLVFLMAGLAGGFSSSLFEQPCQEVAGASGAVFGLIGMQLGDLFLNFGILEMPLIKLGTTVFVLVLVAVMQVTMTPSGTTVSSISHVGGGITGLAASILLLPNLMDKRWAVLQRLVRKLDAEDELQAMVRKALLGPEQQQQQQQQDGEEGEQRPQQEQEREQEGLWQQQEDLECTPHSLGKQSEAGEKLRGLEARAWDADGAPCQRRLGSWHLPGGGGQLPLSFSWQARVPPAGQGADAGGGSSTDARLEAARPRATSAASSTAPAAAAAAALWGAVDAVDAAAPGGGEGAGRRSAPGCRDAGSVWGSPTTLTRQQCFGRGRSSSGGGGTAANDVCITLTDAGTDTDAGAGADDAARDAVIVRSWLSKYRGVDVAVKLLCAVWLLLVLVVQPVYVYTVVLQDLNCDAAAAPPPPPSPLLLG